MHDDEPGTGPGAEPGTEPAQEAHVRALLGDVGASDEPIPAEVSARLDDTLARLRAERVLSGEDQAAGPTDPAADAGPDEDEQADVVPLRRRWLPRAAGAAAAVIVLGVGGVAAVRLGTDRGQDSAASGGVASDTAPSSEASTDAPAPSTGSGATPGPKSRALRESAGAVRALPALTSASFDTDVAALLRTDPDVVTPGDQGTDRSDALLARACPGPAVADGAAATPVRLDGRLAVLLVHPAEEGRQLVEAWTCAGDRRLDSTRLTGSDISP